jgi:hypothetical protein
LRRSTGRARRQSSRLCGDTELSKRLISRIGTRPSRQCLIS